MASVYENSENTCLNWYIPYLEIHVFPSNLIIPPGNSNDFYSTPCIFPLISLTAGGGVTAFLFLEKPLNIPVFRNLPMCDLYCTA